MPNCTNTSVNIRPLNDLGPRTYLGRQGGLYPSGENARPTAHEMAGVGLAATVQALDAAGSPATSGLIGFAVIGFSFAKRLGLQLLPLIAADTEISDSLRCVNAAMAGEDATDLSDPNDNYWTDEVPAALAAAGLTKEQVQACWLVSGSRAQVNGWPGDVDDLTDLLEDVVRNAKAFFPNLKLCYVSTPHYLGYAMGTVAREPNAFEQGFAMKALIERQLAGDVALAYDGVTPVAPWLSWRGYSWTDGVNVRSDGLEWNCPADVVTDGIHQSTAGALKQAKRLLAELKADPTAAPWLLTAGAPICSEPASATIFGDGVVGTPVGGVPLIAISKPPRVGDAAPKLIVERAKPGANALFMLGPTEQAAPFAGGTLYVGFTGWVTYSRTVDATGRAEVVLDAVPAAPGGCGAESFAQVAITDPGASGGYALTEGLKIVVGA